MKDVACFVSKPSASVKFVKGVYGICDTDRVPAVKELTKPWQELVEMGQRFRVVGSEEMRRTALNMNCHFALTEVAYMLLEVVGRSKRKGLTQINLGNELPAQTGVDARGYSHFAITLANLGLLIKHTIIIKMAKTHRSTNLLHLSRFSHYHDNVLQQVRSYEALEEMAVNLLRQHPKQMLCEADLKKQINKGSRSWPTLKQRMINRGIVECFVTKFKSGVILNCIRLVDEPVAPKESEEMNSALVYDQTWEYQIYTAIRETGKKGILRMALSAMFSAYLNNRFVDKLITDVVEKYRITSTLEHNGKILTYRLTVPSDEQQDIPEKDVNTPRKGGSLQNVKRKQIVLDQLEASEIIDAFVVKAHILEMEAKEAAESNETHHLMDRKTFSRLVTTLEQQKKLVQFRTTIPLHSGAPKSVLILALPKYTWKSPEVQKYLQVLREKEIWQVKVQANPSSAEREKVAIEVAEDVTEYRLSKEVKPIDGMIVKQQYGFIKAKMIRCKLLHLFLWCHVYGQGNENFFSRMNEEDVKKLVLTETKEENDVLSELIGSSKPRIDNPSTASSAPWKEGDGSEVASEVKSTPTEVFSVLLSMPLSLFLQIFGCRYRNNELEEKKSVNTPIGELPLHLREILHRKRVWVRSLQALLEDLKKLGLVSGDCKSDNTMNGYNAGITDRTIICDNIDDPVRYKVYTFPNKYSVLEYWNDLEAFALRVETSRDPEVKERVAPNFPVKMFSKMYWNTVYKMDVRQTDILNQNYEECKESTKQFSEVTTPIMKVALLCDVSPFQVLGYYKMKLRKEHHLVYSARRKKEKSQGHLQEGHEQVSFSFDVTPYGQAFHRQHIASLKEAEDEQSEEEDDQELPLEPVRRTQWTPEEDNILLQMYSAALADLRMGKTEQSQLSAEDTIDKPNRKYIAVLEPVEWGPIAEKVGKSLEQTQKRVRVLMKYEPRRIAVFTALKRFIENKRGFAANQFHGLPSTVREIEEHYEIIKLNQKELPVLWDLGTDRDGETIVMLKDYIKMFLIIPDEDYIVELARALFARFSSQDILMAVESLRKEFALVNGKHTVRKYVLSRNFKCIFKNFVSRELFDEDKKFATGIKEGKSLDIRDPSGSMMQALLSRLTDPLLAINITLPDIKAPIRRHIRSDGDENIMFYSQSQPDVCSLSVTSFQHMFFSSLHEEVPTALPSPLRMNIDEPQQQQEGEEGEGKKSMSEKFVEIRTELGDHPEDIQDSLKIFEFLSQQTSLVSTTFLENKFEELGCVFDRLLELEGATLITSIHGNAEMLWGVKEVTDKWSIPGYEFKNESRAVDVPDSLGDLNETLPEQNNTPPVVLQTPPKPLVSTPKRTRTPARPGRRSTLPTIRSSLDAPTVSEAPVTAIPVNNIPAEDPTLLVEAITVDETEEGTRKRKQKQTPTERAKKIRVERKVPVLKENEKVHIQPWCDLHGNIKEEFLSVLTNTITKFIMDFPGITEESLFNDKLFRLYRPAVLRQLLFTLQLQGVISTKSLVTSHPVSLFSSHPKPGISVPEIVENNLEELLNIKQVSAFFSFCSDLCSYPQMLHACIFLPLTACQSFLLYLHDQDHFPCWIW
eukprot:TRINITY_DN8424_c0_g1_i1.p1 TRINITY_DN8424_c0_g1~~TRINITY_DN8424_c0_g1_i1.p1  ORF type:complete len:1647 (-),score=337.25 TRINITY_DN8424_c0_g1_i1:33-4793(-)